MKSLVEKRQTYREKLVFTVVRENNNLLSRNDICKITNYSMTTVASIVDKWIEKGFLAERSSDDARVGRRPVLLSVEPDSVYFAGIECNAAGVNFTVINALHEVVHSQAQPLSKALTVNILNAMDKVIQDFRKSNPDMWEKIPSLTIAFPGVVDTKNGISISYLNVSDWHMVDMKAHFQHLGKDLVFLHNIDSMLLGYCAKNPEVRSSSVMFMLIRNGTSVRLYYKGVLLSDYGLLCEFGHVRANGTNRLCYCGRHGCYDSEISTAAILSKINEALSVNKLSEILRKAKGKADAVTIPMFIELVEEGDADAISIFTGVAQYAAELLAQAFFLFMPENVVICSELCRAKAFLSGIIDSHLGKVHGESAKKCKFNYIVPENDYSSLGGAIAGYDRYFEVSGFDD